MLRVAFFALVVLFASIKAAPIERLKEKLQTRHTHSRGFTFPLANGFPSITVPSPNLTAIENAAQGTLPNGAPPASLNPDDLTSLRLIAFNEIFEVAFFTSLLNNVTQGDEGFSFGYDEQKAIIKVLEAVIAQEELHTLNANGALVHFNTNPIQACRYVFPTTDFRSAIALASTFTDVVLGTLQDVIVLLAKNGDGAVTRGVASVIGQEGEQNGFYRSFLGKIPSALPFLTASNRDFAFSALNQNFIVPGSCPNINDINLQIFSTLTVNTSPIQAQDQTISFTFNSTSYTGQVNGLSLVYINQQNKPINVTLQNVQTSSGKTTFHAFFPFTANKMNGLTICAVTNSSGPFANVDDVAQVTIAGPGLIEID